MVHRIVRLVVERLFRAGEVGSDICSVIYRHPTAERDFLSFCYKKVEIMPLICYKKSMFLAAHTKWQSDYTPGS